MYKYFIEEGHFNLPVKHFSDVKISTIEVTPGKGVFRAEYPNGVILDVTITSKGAEIISNKEFIVDDNGNYTLKEET